MNNNEYILSLPTEEDKKCRLDAFLASLDFVKDAGEFTTASLQRHLGCSYATAWRVIDALCLLNVISTISGPPNPKYKKN